MTTTEIIRLLQQALAYTASPLARALIFAAIEGMRYQQRKLMLVPKV